MKIVEFDHEGRPVERQRPFASPCVTVEDRGPVRVVAFGDEPDEAPGVVTRSGGPMIKIREFDGSCAPRPAGRPVRFCLPSGRSIKIVEFDDDGKVGRREHGVGPSGLKIVEFD